MRAAVLNAGAPMSAKLFKSVCPRCKTKFWQPAGLSRCGVCNHEFEVIPPIPRGKLSPGDVANIKGVLGGLGIAAGIVVGLWLLAAFPDVVGGLYILALAFLIYFAPGICAYRWKHPSRDAILLLNIVAGWTGIGWIITMAAVIISRPKTDGLTFR